MVKPEDVATGDSAASEAKLDQVFENAKQGESNDESPQEEKQEETNEGQETKVSEDINPATEGRERVDLNSDQQKRFNNLYKQVKMGDEKNDALRAENAKLVKHFEGALDRIDAIESKGTETEYTSAMDRLKDDRKVARDEGDEDKIDEINDSIADLKAEQTLKKEEKRDNSISLTPEPPPQSGINLTAEESNHFNNKMWESNADGDLTRPWLHEGDDKYNDCLVETQKIMDEFAADDKPLSIPVMINRLDKVMKYEVGDSGEILSGGNLTTSNNNEKVNYSEEQKYSAKKLGINSKEFDKRANLYQRSSISINDFKKG